nr:hypothetical protein [uncultured Desulfobacter sp.]
MRKKLVLEKEETIVKLKNALQDIKTLEGLAPVRTVLRRIFRIIPVNDPCAAVDFFTVGFIFFSRFGENEL